MNILLPGDVCVALDLPSICNQGLVFFLWEPEKSCLSDIMWAKLLFLFRDFFFLISDILISDIHINDFLVNDFLINDILFLGFLLW